MTNRGLTSYLFRCWVNSHVRPLRLSELRALWREVRRFIREQS
jgi:hypothetical protein